MPLEWSFVLDALQAERDQAVTIDATQIWFATGLRRYVIIDAPGHREFLKNMVSGAASADAAILVVDAEDGLREQTRRHAYLLALLGVQQVAAAINKMDVAGYSETRFQELVEELRAYFGELRLNLAYAVPISAREGDNIARRSGAMPWYRGPTVLEALDGLRPAASVGEQPLRLPVQDVYKFDERRIVAGRLEAGVLRVGDELLFSPSNRRARVASIEAWNAPPPVEAHAGQCVGFTFEEQIFVERGDIASHFEKPPILTSVFRATIFWLGVEPLTVGQELKLRLATYEDAVTVQSIDKVIDTDTLASRTSEAVERNAVAEVTFRCRGVMALDEYRSVPATGRFVLVDGYDTVAAGVASMEGYPDQRRSFEVKSSNIFAVDHGIEARHRADRNGHRGGVLWFTGLSGAGKSTLAMALEQRLFAKGYSVYVLDGDNVRRGLNADLGFAPEERVENIRRVGEVAALFADAGVLCITAFISPYRADRERARQAAEGMFHEVYVNADLETCERRDPKGLYRKARSGEIADFTGVSAPYEPPERPELIVRTDDSSIDQSLGELVDYVDRVFRVRPARS
jgi:bifunctional enzyme CysN/CysC